MKFPDFAALAKNEKVARKKMRYLSLAHFTDGHSRYAIPDMLKVSRVSVNKWVASFIKMEFSVEFQQSNIYRLLHQQGFSWITTRSRHPKQSQAAQDAFKKLPTGNDP